MIWLAYVIERTPLSLTNFKSPYEVISREKPVVKNCMVSSLSCYVHVLAYALAMIGGRRSGNALSQVTINLLLVEM